MKKHEVHNLICEALIFTLNEEYEEENFPGGQQIPPAKPPEIKTPEQVEYARGMQAGMKARTQGGKYIMFYDEQKNHYPPAFWKGYNKVVGESWWNKFNNKLTSLAGRLGYSRTRGS